MDAIRVAEQKCPVISFQLFKQGQPGSGDIAQHRIPCGIDHVIGGIRLQMVPDGGAEFRITDQSLFIVEEFRSAHCCLHFFQRFA